MRGNGDICIFCRNTFSYRSSTRGAKRFASYNRHPEPYVLPRLVIDLDAADSKYVRRVDDTLEPWYPKSSKKPTPNPSTHGTQEPRRKVYLPFKTVITTPPDLLTFALLGDPEGPWRWKTQFLREIYRYRKIQPNDGVFAKALQLTSEFIYDPTERFKDAGWIKGKEKAYEWQLQFCGAQGGFNKLARTVSMFSSTREGCEFLATRGNILRDAIGYCRANQDQSNGRMAASSGMVLRLINNLRINMESKGVEFGPKLDYLGLHYAAKAWNLPSIRKYLEIVSEKEPESIFSFHALRALVLRLLYEPERTAGPMGLATVKLITGWDGVTKPFTRTGRDLSFASIIRKTTLYTLRSGYLAGLAELGLKETLQAEWEADPKNSIGNNVWDHQGEFSQEKFKARIFALAFQLAGDRDSASSILQSQFQPQPEEADANEADRNEADPKESHPSALSILESLSEKQPIKADPNVAEPKESLFSTLSTLQSKLEEQVGEADPKESPSSTQQPHLKDLKITKRTPEYQTIWLFFHVHYYYHNLHAAESLQRALDAVLRDLPQDPQQFLDSMERFFVRGYRGPITSSKLAPKLINWVDEKGVEGLVVLSEEEEDIPLYWKPASQAVV